MTNQAASVLFGILALTLSALAPPAMAQDRYPASPIRLVVGYPPGGAADAIARILAQQLSTQLNVSVVVDNRPGADGNIGAELVARSSPNGHTLLLNTSSLVLAPALGAKLGFDVLKDLAPVALVATASFVLVANPAVPANTVAEFIAHLKANPNKLAYGSSGIGSNTQLAVLLFLQANGLTALHVPYKGPSVIDLVAGRIQFALQAPTSVLAMVKDKRLKALAITGRTRAALLPDVPTLAETAMPGFEVTSWEGVMAPAKTPPALVTRINGEIVKALQEPAVQARLAQEVQEPRPSTPDEYDAHLRGELKRWTSVIQSAGIRTD